MMLVAKESKFYVHGLKLFCSFSGETNVRLPEHIYICHSVYLGWPFLPWQKGWAEHSLQHYTWSNDLHSDAQVHVQTFLLKTDYDVIGALYGNITMMLGIWNYAIYISLEGYKRDKHQIGRGLQVRFQREQIYSP